MLRTVPRAHTRACSPRHAAQQLLDGQQPLRVNQFQQPKLQVEALFLAIVQVVEGAQHDLQVAGELFLGE